MQQAGRYDEAARACEARLERFPRDSDALQALAAAMLALGRTADGLSALRTAAAIAPADARIQATLGRVCTRTGALSEAIASYRNALALDPALDKASDELVALLKATGRYDELEDVCRAAIAAAGESPARRHALAAALFEQGFVDEALAELGRALELEPNAATLESDLLRALNYAQDQAADAVFRAHRAWARRYEPPLACARAAHGNDPSPERRLRIGYVSPYFRKHAVTFFLESVIQHHDRERFDIVLYADVARPDEYSERLKSYGAHWRSTVGVDDATLAQTIAADGVDILVDLSGHTPGNRLLVFARNPAPVQITWNGYPNTTGMTAMRHRITDARCDPPGETEHLHSETLVRLPQVFMTWRAPDDAPDVGALPALATHRVTFGSFNSCYKITARVARLWARVLEAAPEARLVLFAVPDGRSQARLRGLFREAGLPEDRLEIRPRLSHEAFLEAHGEVDIALDTFPYHGTTTTCFSLWMGVPVVSLAGRTHASRVGLTLLSSIGLAHLCARSEDDFVSAAVGLSRDVEALAVLRRDLRSRIRASPLTDGSACAAALERAYREMWSSWCRDRARQTVAETDYGPVVVNRHDSVVGHWLGIDRGWEKNEIELMRWLLPACFPQESAVEILDVGANVGSHTIAFARFPLAGVVVHAFEPQRVIYDMLTRTVAMNGLTNVHCHRSVVSSVAGETIEIDAIDYDAPGDFGSLELEPTPSSDFVAARLGGRKERFETIRIDDLGLTRVKLVKIDAEGMEHKVLAGAVETIERSRPLVFFEHSKTDFARVKELLRDLGYRAYYTQHPNALAVPAELTQLELKGARAIEL